MLRTGRAILHRVGPIHRHPSFPVRPLPVSRSILAVQHRHFHQTPPTNAHPIIPILIATLKSSSALEVARTITRVAISFMPILFLSTFKKRRKLERAEQKGIEHPRKSDIVKTIQHHYLLLRIMVALPSLLFLATIIASLERTPLTGRWRMILMSPEEEEEIASQLAGSGWYRAVNDILQAEGHTKLIHPGDWRYQWVRDTLRDLEKAIPILLRENELCPDWYTQSTIPPPAEYPLRPRPRASEYLRAMAERMCERRSQPPPHNINGPPYSLLLVEDPAELNAFSYGFGPDGAGGLVVYTGFLEDVLRRIPSPPPQQPTPWWSSLLGSQVPQRPSPSPEQTSELAILLAHELSHLILSHHLESLSSAKVIIPGVLSIVTDIIRVMLFPVTIVFGPFVSDAISNVAKMGTNELEKASEHCTSVLQEIEADQVSVRLLSHAGYDPQSAIQFWEQRQSCEALDSETVIPYAGNAFSISGVPRWMSGAGHPVSQIRVDALRKELRRWETERMARRRRGEMKQVEEERQSSSVSLLMV